MKRFLLLLVAVVLTISVFVSCNNSVHEKKVLVSIKVQNKPNTLVYDFENATDGVVGLDSTGLVVQASYSDGSKKYITDYKLTCPGLRQSGLDVPVFVTYVEDKIATVDTFNIDILGKADFKLVSGSAFKTAVESSNGLDIDVSTVTDVVFTTDREDVPSDYEKVCDLSADSRGLVKGYRKGTKVYVLSDHIVANEDCSNMFNGFESLSSIDISNFDMTYVTDITDMFNGCSDLETVNTNGEIEDIDTAFDDFNRWSFENNKYINNKCKVIIIDINNLENPDTVYVVKGEALETGYQMRTYYYDLEFSSSFDISTPINSDITLYFQYAGCIAKGTLITLEDGSRKPVEEVNVGDLILSYNFYTGKIEPKAVLVMEKGEAKKKLVITITTLGGRAIQIMDFQSFFDTEKREYFCVDNVNYKTIIGTKILVREGDTLKEDTIVSTSAKVEEMEYYDLATAENLNFFGNDMLSVLSGYTFVIPFEIDENYVVNQAKMQADIEKYGLLSYEEYPLPMSRELFDGLEMKYHKIIVAKGYVTWEIIAEGFGYAPDILEGWN